MQQTVTGRHDHGQDVAAAMADTLPVTHAAVTPGDDALLEAEREIAETYAWIAAERRRDPGAAEADDAFQAQYARIDFLERFIGSQPAEGFAGIAVKLRRLLDFGVGVLALHAPWHGPMLRSAYDALLEMAGGEAAQRGTPRQLGDGRDLDD